MDTHKDRFPFSQVADAANMPVATLRSWFSAGGPFSLQDTDEAAPPGGVRLLSSRTAKAVAIAEGFTRLHAPVTLAAKAGLIFAHTEIGYPKRPSPGALYRTGKPTLIMLRPDEAPDVRIFAVGQEAKLALLLPKVGDGGSYILHADTIVARVLHRLTGGSLRD